VLNHSVNHNFQWYLDG